MEKSEERILQLHLLLAEDPADPFLHYALCLELRKQNPLQAEDAFEKTLQKFPEYLPLYYQAALQLAESGKISEAISLATRGILLAEIQGEHHAMTELKGLKQNILAGEFD